MRVLGIGAHSEAEALRLGLLINRDHHLDAVAHDAQLDVADALFEKLQTRSGSIGRHTSR